MVGEDHYSEILACRLEILIDRSQNQLIDLLDRENLVLNLGAVTALVRRFDVDVDEIIAVVKRVDSRVSLSGPVGVDISGSSLDIY